MTPLAAPLRLGPNDVLGTRELWDRRETVVDEPVEGGVRRQGSLGFVSERGGRRREHASSRSLHALFGPTLLRLTRLVSHSAISAPASMSMAHPYRRGPAFVGVNVTSTG